MGVIKNEHNFYRFFLCMEKNDNQLKSIKVAIKVEKCS